MGSGLALAISQASHFLQPPPHQSIIIERMHSGMSYRNTPYFLLPNWYLQFSIYSDFYILKYILETDLGKDAKILLCNCTPKSC